MRNSLYYGDNLPVLREYIRSESVDLIYLDPPFNSSGKAKRAVVQVKSGQVSSGQVRDLVGTVDREKAPIGIFITLEEPTTKMREEAAAAGFHHSPGWGQDYPRIQLLTIQELLDGAAARLPASTVTFKQAGKLLKESTVPQIGFSFYGAE